MEEVKVSWAAAGDVAATSTERQGQHCVSGLGKYSVPEEARFTVRIVLAG
jgi:hypothetical protein